MLASAQLPACKNCRVDTPPLLNRRCVRLSTASPHVRFAGVDKRPPLFSTCFVLASAQHPAYKNRLAVKTSPLLGRHCVTLSRALFGGHSSLPFFDVDDAVGRKTLSVPCTWENVIGQCRPLARWSVQLLFVFACLPACLPTPKFSFLQTILHPVTAGMSKYTPM